MSSLSLAVVVHGAHWPDTQRATTIRDQFARITGTAVEIVIARDEPSRPRGAAACVNDAIAASTADVMVIADSVSACDDATLRELLARVHQPPDGHGLAWVGDEMPTLPAAEIDVIAAMASLGHDVVVPDDPAFWAVTRAAWQAAGGLDPRFWSIGAVSDLAARLAVLVERTCAVPVVAAPTLRESYPLVPEIRVLLAWRNPLITLARSAPQAALGRTLSLALTRLLAAAWRGTGLQASDVTFGGTWVEPHCVSDCAHVSAAARRATCGRAMRPRPPCRWLPCSRSRHCSRHWLTSDAPAASTLRPHSVAMRRQRFCHQLSRRRRRRFTFLRSHASR